jgi:hypothetical protein
MARDPGTVALGEYLRGLRLRRNGSLEEMARSTRISERHLRALESDDRQPDLPAPVFVKGFIRAYCDFLGEPADEALRLYGNTLAVRPAVPVHPLPGRGRASWISHPIVVSGVMLLVFGAGLLALNLGVGGGPRRAVEPGPPAPQGEPAVANTPPAMVTVSEPEGAAAQRLVVKAVEATWIRVQTDDGRVAEELLAPGATREWTSGRHFVLTVGNAGGVELELNGRPLPSLGARGAVIHRLSLPEPPAGS